jgi:hypothetical protein
VIQWVDPLQRWFDAVARRSAVVKGSAVLSPWELTDEDAERVGKLAQNLLS